MNRPYQITGAIFLLFSAFIAWEAWNNLLFYTPIGPGAGFFPFWLAVVLGILSLVMIYNATFKREEPMPSDFLPTHAGYLRIGAILMVLVLTILLIVPLGFRLTTLAFLIALMYTLGRPTPLATVPIAIAGSWGTYWVFVELLRIPLPVGNFGI